MDRGSEPVELKAERVARGRSRLQLPLGATVRRSIDIDEQPLQIEMFGCEMFDHYEPQALGLTYWFDPGLKGESYPMTIRFAGRRIGVQGRPGRRDRFSALESVDHVMPGSGPIALTTRIRDVAPGEWHVTAAPANETGGRSARRLQASTRRSGLPNASSSGSTAYAPVMAITAPGARFGAWPALVGLGAAVALTTQAILASHSHLPVTRVLSVSLLAAAVGLAAAKLYYLTGHLLKGDRQGLGGFLTGGLCIQGFVLGAFGALGLGAWAVGVPVGALLDLTAPGLLFGMTIGRFGCFFGGCCAGRPTASRWGLWSSDRRLGMRRIPTQLLESAVAMIVGLAALLAVWVGTPGPAGVVFVGAIAAYTFGRQLLFPLRAGPRHTAHGRTLTMALSGLVVAIDAAVMASSK